MGAEWELGVVGANADVEAGVDWRLGAVEDLEIGVEWGLQ